jgi:hypothetical protein
VKPAEWWTFVADRATAISIVIAAWESTFVLPMSVLPLNLQQKQTFARHVIPKVMQIGRLITFTLAVIGGGLMQLWVLLLVLKANGHPLLLKDLLGDGGLFFFATSLAVGSSISLFDSHKLVIGNADCNITLIVCGGVVLLAVIYYASTLSSSSPRVAAPFAKHIGLQLGCCCAAVVYWYYTGVRTGLFTKKDV